VQVRPYAHTDWPTICEIHDLARRIELAAASLDAAFLRLDQAAENEGLFDYQLLVLQDEAQVLGFVAFSPGELAWLYVHPRAHRRGVGTRLVHAAITATQGNLSVEILKGNDVAVALYKKAGFQEHGQSSGRMPGNEAFEVTVTELRLTRAA